MMTLPQSFIDKYTDLLGEEAQAFFASFDQPAVSGFRLNPLKQIQKDFDQPMAGMPWSYYGKVSGRSIDHVTGLVYSQEPAAQVVGHVAQPQPGMRVLDLAAAPGGKSTHLLSFLNHTGLLVSNDISKKRSRVLVENLERFGARNTVVTNETAERLAKVFPDYFDLIVLDAPCSGEGMFRKDPEAISYWSLDYPLECARLQKTILAEAIKMLAPGGQLIYSTCTWSPEENEEVVQWLLATYPDLCLEPVPRFNGMKPGIGMPEVARMYPHHFQGEGQFVAKLRDTRDDSQGTRLKPGQSNLSREQAAYWQDFAKQHLRKDLPGLLQVFGDELYLLPADLPDLSRLRIARNGLHLGTFKTKRFEPSFALGLALGPDETKQSLEIGEQDFEAYVRGHALSLDQTYPTGWYQLLVNGLGLGFAKVVGQTVKNNYPKGLRQL